MSAALVVDVVLRAAVDAEAAGTEGDGAMKVDGDRGINCCGGTCG